MASSRTLNVGLMLLLFAGGYTVGRSGDPVAVREAEAAVAPVLTLPADRVFELRTYTAPEGKLDALLARFRNDTVRLFERHGITNVGYWVPLEQPGRDHTLIYLIAHPSAEAAERNWAAFREDPEWRRAVEESQRDGRIVSSVESVYLGPTDFSEMR